MIDFGHIDFDRFISLDCIVDATKIRVDEGGFLGLAAEGRTILFISHKLEEVLKCSDAITVMRAGRVVANTTAETTSVEALAHPMLGDNVPALLIETRALPTGDPLFSIRGIVARDPVGFERLGPLDLDIRPGEIVGVAGVGGNGQDELIECAAGILSLIAGAIRFLVGSDASFVNGSAFVVDGGLLAKLAIGV